MKKQSQFSPHEFSHFSPAFKNVIEIVDKIAPHNIPVLIEGEIGTGKEWLARRIHFAGPRTAREFIAIDCSSSSDVFLESELLGYVRGSFAGAIHDKKGLLERADGGTVFLDHISKMKPTLQGKLFRILSDGTFHKIGGVAQIEVDIRLIAATDEDLSTFVSKGKFREDLYYLLNVMRVTIPPLRERREDILLLADWFLAQIAKRDGEEKKTFTKEAESILKAYDWPANVRELESEVEKSIILAGSNQKISPSHLAPILSKRKRVPFNSKAISGGSLKEQKRKMVGILEKNAITEALRKTAGNRTKAAQILAISRQELIRKISAYKIKSRTLK